MVFAGEGLRAPSLPPRVNNSPPPVTSRAVAGALLSAAAGVAGTVGLPSAPLNAPYAGAPPPITRDAPTPSSSAVNPLLSGATGGRAPGLGGSMPGVRSPAAAMPRSLPAMPSSVATRGPRLAGMGPALADAGLRRLGEELQGTSGSPFYGSPEQQLKNDRFAEAQRQSNDYLRESAKQAARNFGDFLKNPLGNRGRESSNRKGDTSQTPIKKGNGSAPSGSQVGKMYRVDGTVSNGISGSNPFSYTLPGSIGPIVTSKYSVNGFEYLDALFSSGVGVQSLLSGGDSKGGASAAITGIMPIDGIPDPAMPADPDSFRGGDGLALVDRHQVREFLPIKNTRPHLYHLDSRGWNGP
ncbi:hypothetical protein H6F76_20615 [Leptolyngbya sp. FACHB-321]|uniref:hypothetical protein n=1 Tax=Leptolyngbya sp. FACHB-321 TaxID=2692807 RepID=UPI001686FA28|nr:hypothetical protein [Leptolyngbya sp. FACHB-321]MBD2037371.1 hypothetical protein [Leptolyngbya sp. FACHB-321]